MPEASKATDPNQVTSTVAAPPPQRAAPAPAPVQHAPPPQPAAMTAAPAAAMAPAQPQQPGLFAQMASTAAGVAVGSAVGHAVGHGMTSLFSGSGGSEEAVPQAAPQPAPAAPQYEASPFQAPASHSCDADLKAFTNCMESNNNDFSACQFYMDMLKQCQSFAASRV
ncbi:hypothetical protein K493DRAFT_331260 [Basidiobolus meristosporus CBS 931.73]|uniref:CHCH domain-containing protein n=1 Tax=Basidiobolus meristosporus CBS 931.73 TaxID=1314790 RepID=A0A1Y1XTM6_9FUNG|nr:hypothetical protein K493DRAFT_331260 [Basidiobolus meristosporus CBS 931.73]|eukprot:ORX89090.1 hypothetical protein K493DRAFT_331260 [Basidiobolus meristosporus CBS 931.73]